jgi:hypothetical protein
MGRNRSKRGSLALVDDSGTSIFQSPLRAFAHVEARFKRTA